MKRLSLCLAVMAGLWASAAYADDSGYVVTLARPQAVGEVYDVREKVVSASSRTVTKAGESRALPAEGKAAEVVGRIRVEAVDAGGRARDFTLTVKSLVGPSGKELLPSGTQVQVFRKETGVEVKQVGAEGPLAPEALSALQALYQKVNKTDVPDDAVFPAKGLKKAGDTWELDAAKASGQAAAAGVTVDPKNMKGKATLKSAGNDGLQVELVLEATDVRPPNTPATIKYEKAEMRAKQVVEVPADGAKKFSSVLEQRMVMAATREEGGESLRMEMTVDLTRTSSRVLVKQPAANPRLSDHTMQHVSEWQVS